LISVFNLSLAATLIVRGQPQHRPERPARSGLLLAIERKHQGSPLMSTFTFGDIHHGGDVSMFYPDNRALEVEILKGQP